MCSTKGKELQDQIRIVVYFMMDIWEAEASFLIKWAMAI